jgi:hypothetical protein
MPPGNPLPVVAGPPKTPAAPASATTPAAPATTLRTNDAVPHAPAAGAGCVALVRPGIGAPFRRLPLRRTYRRAASRRNYRCAFQRIMFRSVKYRL